MPILYESYARDSAKLKVGETYRVGFRAIFESLTPQQRRLAATKLKGFNWAKHGLRLKAVSVRGCPKELKGYVDVEKVPSFIVVTGPLLAAIIVPSALALIGTIIKAWTVVTVVHPLLAPGPLGLPMIVWVLVSAAGVLIPTALILRRK